LATLLTPSAYALHKDTPGAARVTSGTATVHPGTRSWGYYLGFSSPDDVLDTGSTGRQVFVFSLFDYDCLHGSGGALAFCPSHPTPYVQVTAGAGDPDNPSVADKGTIVAFDADGAYAGGTGPGLGHRQIFLKNLATSELRRITDHASGDSTRPSLTERGRYLVFQSTAGLLGGPAGVSQIFAYDVNAQTLTRVTDGAGSSTDPVPNKLGRLVTFASTADLLGDGHDTGVSQIFWFERAGGEIHQLTTGNGPSRRPQVTSRLRGRGLKLRGAAIVFESEATDLPGASGVAGPQIYAGGTGDGDLPLLFRLTPPDLPGCVVTSSEARFPSVDASSRRVAFVGTGDLLCNGTSGNRAFVLDIRKLPNTLYQITGQDDVQGPVAASLGHWFISMSTTSDLTGDGVCAHQLHVVDYFTGHWQASTTVGQPPVHPAPGDPVASCDDDDPCTTESCNPSTGCEHTPIVGCP
jgi:hypothetical protein